jgi:hypothetical protein
MVKPILPQNPDESHLIFSTIYLVDSRRTPPIYFGFRFGFDIVGSRISL